MAATVSRDVLSYIFSLLQLKDVKSVSCVCKAWNVAVVSEIWKNLQLRCFGPYLVPKTENKELNWKQIFFENQRKVEFPISIPFACNHFSVAKGCADGKILLFSMLNANKTNTYRKVILEGHQGRVTCLHFGSNEILSGSEDRTIRVWDLGSNKCRIVLKGHEGPITGLTILHEMILSASEDGEIRAWSAANYRCIKTYSYSNSITFSAHLGYNSFLYGSSKTLFGYKNGSLCLFDWQKNGHLVSKQVRAHSSEITCFIGKPERFFTGSKDGTVRCWTDNEPTATLFSGHRSPITGLCLFKDKLYSSSCNGILECPVESFFMDEEIQGSIFYQPQGTVIYIKGNVSFGTKDWLFGWEDRQVKLWRIFKRAKEEIFDLATHPEPVMNVCLVSRTFFSISTGDEVLRSCYSEAASLQNTAKTCEHPTKKRKF